MRWPLKGKKNMAAVKTIDAAALYEEHKAPLRRFIANRVTLREDVEDILHDVYVKLLQVDQLENPIEQATGWIYSVTRNLIVDRRRKKREESMPVYRSGADGEFLLTLAELLSDAGDSPETEYFKSLVWEEIEQVLEELPPEQAHVFILTEMEGFSFREISENTGVAVNTLLSRKRYAVVKLRERLQEFYTELLED